MFSQNDEIKLIDFGVAIQRDKDDLSKLAPDGTPCFIAPEVLTSQYGKECDVWSLGVSLYYMLAGQLPFKSTQINELYGQIQSGKYDEMPDNVTSEAQDLISKMLTVDPKKRITIKEALKHPWI